MSQGESPVKLLIPLALLLAILAVFSYLWYRRIYVPGTAAAKGLDLLSRALSWSNPAWHADGPVSVRDLWTTLLPIYEGNKVDIRATGRWDRVPAIIEYKLPAGGDQAGDVAVPGKTILRIPATRPLAKWAGVTGMHASPGAYNAWVALGVSPSMETVQGDLMVWGESGERSLLTVPAVLKSVRALPRDAFGLYGTEGLVIKGSDIRLELAGHVRDANLIAAGFRLLKLIRDNNE